MEALPASCGLSIRRPASTEQVTMAKVTSIWQSAIPMSTNQASRHSGGFFGMRHERKPTRFPLVCSLSLQCVAPRPNGLRPGGQAGEACLRDALLKVIPALRLTFFKTKSKHKQFPSPLRWRGVRGEVRKSGERSPHPNKRRFNSSALYASGLRTIICSGG